MPEFSEDENLTFFFNIEQVCDSSIFNFRFIAKSLA